VRVSGALIWVEYQVLARKSADNGKREQWLPLDHAPTTFSGAPTQIIESVDVDTYAEAIDELSQNPNGYF